MGLHAQIPFLRAGGIGVYVFFTLSGFLITRLLLQEKSETGGIRLSSFYLRRVLRLGPALLLVLAAGTIYSVIWAPPELARASLRAIPAVVFYYANWYRAFAVHPTLGLYDHTWSLSVEEQFYLVWPAALTALLLLRRRYAAVVLVGLAIVAVEVWRVHLFRSLDDLYRIANGTDTVADQLLAGCFLALATTDARGRSVTQTITKWLWAPAALSLLVVVLTFPPHPTLGTWRRFELGEPGIAIASSLVIGRLVLAPDAWLARVFAWRPLVWVGRISYGLYLWHVPVFIVMAYEASTVARRYVIPVEFTLSFVLAIASYVAVERPALRLKHRVGGPAQQRASNDSRPAVPAGHQV